MIRVSPDEHASEGARYAHAPHRGLDTIETRAPEYPGYKAACNGCGYCCAVEPCFLAREVIGVTRGPCPAMEFDGGRFWCGLVRNPSRHIDVGPAAGWKDEVLGEMFGRALGVGMGCDAEPEPLFAADTLGAA